ncbi:MAG: PH domain-containing protein [Muribaculaceae bacterium]|nr:PH domain-containing protein [Muribaculaceae bacterium]
MKCKWQMDTTIYNSKVDWWVPAVVIFTVVICIIGPIIDGELLITGLIMGLFLFILEAVMFGSVKYQISDGRLGVRNPFYRWEWFPIDKISEVKKTSGILAGAALSTKRISIKFYDRKILKSSMPIEISPKDRDGFIARLKEINPNIIIK